MNCCRSVRKVDVESFVVVGRTTQSHDRMNIHGIIFEYTHTAARLTDKNLTNLNNAFVRQLMHDSVTSVMFAMLGEPQSY